MSHWAKLKKLNRVELLEKPPQFATKPPPSRKGSARDAGLLYERKIMKWLDGQLHSDQMLMAWPWFHFYNGDKQGWCSPDFVIPPTLSTPLIVGEIKLQYKRMAEKKLRELYGPIVAAHLDVDPSTIKYVQIAKSLTKGFKGSPISTLDKLCEGDFDYAVLHKYRFN